MIKGLREFEEQRIDFVRLTKECRILDNGQKYSEAGEDWQFKIDEAIANFQCIYLQLARGHDKTDRFAWWSMLWLNSTYNAKGYCCGVDADNAALFRESSRKIKAIHPELFADIEVQKKFVFNRKTGSTIETISSDVDSAYGLNFDLLIINDFHAWPKEAFWAVIWSACGKKPGIRVWIESNALTLGTEGANWVSKQRKAIKKFSETLLSFNGGISLKEGDNFDISYNEYKNEINQGKKWWFYCPTTFLARWQHIQLHEWQETLHPSVYRRLIENQDTSGEESFVTIEQVEAITVPVSSCKGGIAVTAVDLGLKKDATAIATVVALPSLISPTIPRNEQKKLSLRLIAMDVVTGSLSEPVQLRAVEQLILHHRKQYDSTVLIDPWSAASLIQKYSWIVEWPFTTMHVRELTQCLYRVIADRSLLIPPHCAPLLQDGDEWDLQKELTNAVVKDMSYGQRVDHKAGGYSDRLMALGMCIHYLISECHLPTKIISPSPEERGWSKEIVDGMLTPLLPVGVVRC